MDKIGSIFGKCAKHETPFSRYNFTLPGNWMLVESPTEYALVTSPNGNQYNLMTVNGVVSGIVPLFGFSREKMIPLEDLTDEL